MIVNQDSLETGPQMKKFRALKNVKKNGHKMPDLKRLPNPHPDTNFLARFTQPGFTSLCPVSAQPDFAQLAINYAPNQFIVET